MALEERSGGRRSAAERGRVLVAFVAVAFMGSAAGVQGVLLPRQADDYGIGTGTVSLVFVAFAVGYMVSAVANGPLIHRLGMRGHVMVGAGVVALALAAMALRPSFGALVLLQVAYGYGMGALDAGLNAYLSGLERSRSVLNSFHAFFGIGALIGPVVAAAMMDAGLSWPAVYAALAGPAVLLFAALTSYPAALVTGRAQERPRVSAALAYRVVWISAAFLAVYLGLEIGFGDWGVAFLEQDRGQEVVAAGWTVSGYWAGLTLGRFVLNALAERVGIGMAGLTAGCIGGVVAGIALVWATASPSLTAAGLVAVGFFLGPIFPTMIAAVPRLVPEPLVATAIGILIATSIVGSAVFPWLIGALADRSGMWVLLPVTLALAGLLAVAWWRIGVRLRSPGPAVVPIDR